MDEGNSRRSLSPYHEKCFPPYCDNAQQIDKAVVSKMDRGDLEDKYIVFADENLELKKQNRNQERQIQRLQTAIQRQDRLDKKSGLTPTSVMAETNKVAILESQNKNLQAKVKVLKQQLMNHSYIHSKEGRINDAKMKQAQVKTPRELEYNPVPNQTQSARDAKPDRNVAALKMRINELEDQLETQKNKYKARLAQLEKELAALEKEAAKSGTSVNEQLSETSRQVKDNTELIKLRMQAEKQAAELEELREKLQSAEEKTEKLREQLRDSKDKVGDLERQLEKERNKSRSAISQASRGTTHMETIRALEEQIRDLQKEKETLKDTNDKLLHLTQTKSEKSLKMPSGHSIQIHQLEKTLKEKMEELYEKEAKISDLEQQLTEAQKEKSIIAPQSVKSIQVEQQISELEKALKEKIEELDEKKAQISELEKQLAEAQKEKSIIAPHQSVKSIQVEQQISELEKALKEKIEELDKKKAQISELEKQLAEAQKEKSIIAPSQSVKSIQVEQKSEFEKALKEKIEELDEKKAQISELEKQLAEAQKEKSIIAPSLSAKSVQAEVKVPSKECEKCADLSEQLTSALKDNDRLKALQEDEVPSKSCENCEDLSKQLTSALMDTAKLKALLERQKTPPPTPKRSESDEALRNLNQRLEEELKKALQELHALRPIAEEHMDNCQKHPPITNSKSSQFPGSTVSFKEAVEVIHKPTPVHSEDSVHSKKTIDSDRYIALTKQLEQALWENERLKKQLQERGGDEALKRQNQILEDELNQALRELREVRPIAEEHNKHCSALRTEIITREHCHHAEEHLEPEYAKEVSTGQTIHTMFTTQQASPVPSYSSRDKKERRKQKWPDAKSVISNSKKEEKQTENIEMELPKKVMEEKKVKEEKSLFGPKEGNQDIKLQAPEEKSVVIKNKNSQLEKPDGTEEKTKTEFGNMELTKLESLYELSTMLEEIESEFQHSESLEKDTSKPQLGKVVVNESPSTTSVAQSEISSDGLSSLVPLANAKRLLRRRARPPLRSSTLTLSSLPAKEDEGRQPYVSHVSPPPSEHCVKTVDINDPAQRANLVIVSKHDFETVLMQKKKYTTEVEVMEPADDRQSLNCKLEICMFDLDIDNRMMEYLSSIQPEPKVYVEWSFVGLDQRTAPLPAERALFYTNVMYFGPLSSEIKHYLNKVEMPIDLYLVRSSGHPVKVAEGTLDMLQAMEQPNRCFIRSVFLRGKDLPSRYATDRAMATVNCSFILHECCVGDPPFRDQLEVAIGTLYLKNRDGGVVPDHATHIYIEYALLGHCGPDLETDSIPRGEVMKFKHSKKLRVNDENAPHLKAMLEDRDPKLLRFTVCAEPCSLTADTEVETMGHADVNLNEEMIKRGQDLVSSQVPVYSVDGEHLGSLSVTILGIGTLQQIYADGRVKSR